MDFFSYFDFLRDKKKAGYLLVGLLVVFLLFTAVVYLLPTTLVDLEFSEEVQEHSFPLLDMFMKGVSWFGETWVAISLTAALALLFFLIDHKTEALFIVLALLSTLITFGIKVLVNRPRPTQDVVNIVVQVQHQSFPSGHTSFYVVFFGFLIFLMLRHRHFPRLIRKIAILLSASLICLVPFSRVYLGAHWFTDVAAGFILGLIILYFLITFYLKKAVKEEAGA